MQLKIVCGYGEDVAIDVYTHREPHSGKGLNQASDAFTLGEEVILYASVTYGDEPVNGAIVSFEVHGPVNHVQSISFYRTNETRADGVADIRFRIPLSEEVVFGFWNVIATTEIGGVRVKDTLSFQVGWIVEILGVEIIDVQNISKASFMHGEQMYFEVRVKNIAMTDKVATITVDVSDEFNAPLGHVVMEDKNIPRNTTSRYYTEGLLIPDWASVGIGVVHVNAYTALPAVDGIPWCPIVSTTFEIKALRDVAIVKVEASPTKVQRDGVVHISVIVKNNGGALESFNVSTFYDSISIGVLLVENLDPGMNRTLAFDWDTSSVDPGNYTISAVASPVPEETSLADNTLIDGVVEVLPPSVEPIQLLWLLIFLAVLVGASLFFVIWRKSRKEKRTLPKYANFKHLYKKRTDATEDSRNSFICPHCGGYHLWPRERASE